MLVDRVKVVLILLPIGLVVFFLGGYVYATTIALVLGLASYEYTKLFKAGGLQPASGVVVLSTIALALSRAYNAFDSAPWILVLIIFVSMSYHLVAFERGRDQAGTDFAVTLSGALYFGWLGAYLISLRAIPDETLLAWRSSLEGFWWLLLTLACVWIGDSGAYFVGRRFGKHHMSPRLSPKKTWEGYVGEIVTGVLGGLLLAYIFSSFSGYAWGSTTIQPWHGAVLGFVLAIITPLGDLGESMVKRQVGVKDSGNLLPGHGGAWDRIDSWLWAGAIGYYLIVLFFLP